VLSSLRVIIFDFDGVVVESNDVKTRAFEKVFAHFPEHAEAMMEFHHAHVSLTRFAKFDHLAQLLGRADDLALKSQIATDFSNQVFAGMLTVPLVPGAEIFLRYAKTRFPLYLASVTPEPELNSILFQRGLAHWFEGVYGCPPWTKSDAIRDVLLKKSVKPGEALLIGDSAGDQRAALETGVCFMARNSGLGFDAPEPSAFTDLYEIARYFEEQLV
jgi:phosphoglycolate phosphatase-like HAD superfamily hydrolase